MPEMPLTLLLCIVYLLSPLPVILLLHLASITILLDRSYNQRIFWLLLGWVGEIVVWVKIQILVCVSFLPVDIYFHCPVCCSLKHLGCQLHAHLWTVCFLLDQWMCIPSCCSLLPHLVVVDWSTDEHVWQTLKLIYLQEFPSFVLIQKELFLFLYQNNGLMNLFKNQNGYIHSASG